MRWYLAVLRRYAAFGGRARRTEFWAFWLVNLVVMVVLGVVGGLLGIGAAGHLVVGVYLLAVLSPWLAVTARRLHDVGRTGWWQSIAVVPYAVLLLASLLPDPSSVVLPVGLPVGIVAGIGGLVMLGFLGTAGRPGANRYGPDPRQLTGPADGGG